MNDDTKMVLTVNLSPSFPFYLKDILCEYLLESLYVESVGRSSNCIDLSLSVKFSTRERLTEEIIKERCNIIKMEVDRIINENSYIMDEMTNLNTINNLECFSNNNKILLLYTLTKHEELPND